MKSVRDGCLRTGVQHKDIWSEDGIQKSLGHSEN